MEIIAQQPLSLSELTNQAEAHMASKGYSKTGLIRYRKIWNHFIRYSKNACFSLDLGISFLKDAYGIEWEEYPKPMARYKRRSLSAIRHLRDFELTGEIGIHRPMKPPYVWPKQFSEATTQYLAYLDMNGYSKDHVRGTIRDIHKFVVFLDANQVKNCEEINISYTMLYIRSHCTQFSVNTLKTVVGRIRSFLKFLYLNEFNKCDIPALIPPVRCFRLAQIPVIWEKDCIHKLLTAIDRAAPEGKRDYAIFMLAVNLGLRIGDILHLQFHNIDWDKAIIQISQIKTDELLTLPISEEIGWALIDYIKNGRPLANNNYIFVRHCAPFQMFCVNNNFHYQIRKYAALAGIKPPSEKLYGIHSLRHTFAVNLLKEGISLSLISEFMGHRGSSATAIYLKADEEQLRVCALDPEIEVIGNS